MMADIKANVKKWDDRNEVTDYLRKILNKEAFDRSGLIYGLGHAVYKVSDPRAEILMTRPRSLWPKTKSSKRVQPLQPRGRNRRAAPRAQQDGFGLCVNADFYWAWSQDARHPGRLFRRFSHRRISLGRPSP